MNILKSIREHASQSPNQAAVISNGERLTYQELDSYSSALACFLLDNYGTDKTPIIVYGHKEPFMLVCFLACVKAGHAYCPIDISVPCSRLQQIVAKVNPSVILSADSQEHHIDAPNVLKLKTLQEIAATTRKEDKALSPVKNEETFYIIFTSGSTGNPKGVQISENCLGNFLDWSIHLGNPSEEKENVVFLNQAPFSFDLSVMDLYTCLASGGTLWTLDKATQSDYRKLLTSLSQSGAAVWVSTPSFADMCLAEPKFCQELLPKLKLFIFCGETLTNHTASKLKQRFKNSIVMNTYGPTESTVALTQTAITDEILAQEPSLPVGKVKEGSLIEIWDEQGHPVPDGQTGEIILIGDTVSTGYFQNSEQTEKVFFTCERDGHASRGYRTGDAGFLKGDMLYYQGRLDLQVKLHGYRIELEDIEQNLLKLEGVRNAVVTPNMQEGKVRSLTAHLVYDKTEDDRFHTINKLKEEMKRFLPDYMIPKKIRFLEQIPMTVNGKADRKKLGGSIS